VVRVELVEEVEEEVVVVVDEMEVLELVLYNLCIHVHIQE
jgi:hypothetical protein